MESEMTLEDGKLFSIYEEEKQRIVWTEEGRRTREWVT